MNQKLAAALLATLTCSTQRRPLWHNGAEKSQYRDGRSNQTLYQQRYPTFLSMSSPQSHNVKISPLCAGWGRTERYTWNEDERNVYVYTVVGPTVTADDIDVDIKSNAIHAINKKKPVIPILSGNTKGAIDVDGSFWTLEEDKGMRQLIITIRKAEKEEGQWFGVLLNEKVQQQTYEPITHHDVGHTKAQSLEPKAIFWRTAFPTVDAKQLEEILKRWMSRDSTDNIPFGKPKLTINISFIPESTGGKIVYETDRPDIDEYLDVIVTPMRSADTKNTSEGAQITFVNSPTTRIISGEMGQKQAENVITALRTLIKTFEKDVHRLDGLMKNREQQTEGFDYMGSTAYLDADNLDGYIKYHEELRELAQGSKTQPDPNKVFRDEVTGLTIDWNKTDDGPDVSQKENEQKKKILINQLTEAVKRTQKPQPEETIKYLVENVRKSLALTDVEYDQLMQKADERIEKENIMLAEKQKTFSQIKSVSELDEATPSVEEIAMGTHKTTEKDTFDIAMTFPEKSMLARKYETISSVQKDRLRRRWKSNEKRLKLLITELLEASPDKCPTICNNYRQVNNLLLSEDYPTLMRSYLCFNKVEGSHEKQRLTFLNEFVLSLYKDQRIYLLQDEKIQLGKIKQIILWARDEFENLNDLIMKNKHQYDTNFICYLNLAISKEVQRIKEEYGDQTLETGAAKPHDQPWLCVLTVIQRAIYAIAKADMAEDLYFITNIASFEDPGVRSYMLEFILATMPRSDWKAFKDLILSASNSLLRNPPEERDDLKDTQPHFVEAIMQMRNEVEKMIPDWIIDEMLSEEDRNYMIKNNRLKCPILQLDLEPKQDTTEATQLPDSAKISADKQTPNQCRKCGAAMGSCDALCFFCRVCSWPVESSQLTPFNPFEIFKLPINYKIDRAQLNKQYKSYQFILHPDRHAAKQDEELQIINTNSSIVNNHYRTLLDDKGRAKLCFCIKYGEEEFNRAMETSEPAQLEQIMEMHEQIASLKDSSEAKMMQQQLEKTILSAVKSLEDAFENDDKNAIITHFKTLSFYIQLMDKLKELYTIKDFTVLGRGISPPTTPHDIAVTSDVTLRTHSTVDAKGLIEPKVQTTRSPLDCGTLFIVKVPHIGNGITQGKIQQWYKQKGDHVDVGELICVIETEQVLVKVQSQFAGIVVENVGNEGCKVRVGADLLIIRSTEETEDEVEDEEKSEED
ncbi:Dihydrolipoyllysine-residue succinyltransferase component of 2-oxoglutarate dehydrogenase complex [Babesia sp. Xinjiang]|uniref:Dihydrolipoyllysine-residue succinyltransferase component of 2-oxoglutarate dehydrogenase complex n=1 Tax=Babesia sp. Xinjiang TaxID=462227 RepID=UPI000A247FAB|nr:Dihydrolipoyllysine-residue succinyltransferase component of 2-oxoglutarate dehydrogenase complex [Babesia sp. Xinjiang]ORM41838.1 Dihydrolipoyllysine-residue succinyltransferase component of 2-oxoglutarate dehydrogenase complex [Babesia sp. Xinjiang]